MRYDYGKICICLSLALMLVLCGCTQKNESLSSAPPSSASQAVSSKADIGISDVERESVVNLPNELYQVDDCAYADILRYDFKVEEKIGFTITVEVTAGQLSLGIKNRESQNYAYDTKEFQSETDSVILEKGKYSVEIKQSEFTGSYCIEGTPVK